MRPALSIADRQFIAGFLDGDGSVKMPKQSYGLVHPCPFVDASQSYNAGAPPELVHIRSLLGGTIHQVTSTKGNQRAQWHLTINSVEGATAALECIEKHGIVKREAASFALAYLRNGRKDPVGTRVHLSAATRNYQDIVIDEDRLTDAYLAGLFMAEGHVAMRASRGEIYASITQKGCIRLLHAIVKKLGFGSVVVKRVNFPCNQARAMLERFRVYMPECQKRPQMDQVLEYLATRTSGKGYKRSPESKHHIEQVAKRLKEMKKM